MSSTKTPAQEALLALRRKQGWTQQQLAVAMGATVVSVCRWETTRPPSGITLIKLASFAREIGAHEEAGIFQSALREALDYTLYEPSGSTMPDIFGDIARSLNPSVFHGYIQILEKTAKVYRLVIDCCDTPRLSYRRPTEDGDEETPARRKMQGKLKALEFELEQLKEIEAARQQFRTGDKTGVEKRTKKKR